MKGIEYIDIECKNISASEVSGKVGYKRTKGIKVYINKRYNPHNCTKISKDKSCTARGTYKGWKLLNQGKALYWMETSRKPYWCSFLHFINWKKMEFCSELEETRREELYAACQTRSALQTGWIYSSNRELVTVSASLSLALSFFLI